MQSTLMLSYLYDVSIRPFVWYNMELSEDLVVRLEIDQMKKKKKKKSEKYLSLQ